MRWFTRRRQAQASLAAVTDSRSMATALFRDLDEPTFVPNQDILNLVRDDDDLAATPEGPVMLKVVCRRDPRLPENQQPQPLRFKMKHVRATIVRVVQGRTCDSRWPGLPCRTG